jgi:plasmid segregation protein ParM
MNAIPPVGIGRASDIGYGHAKWSNGRDASGRIQVGRFPSKSPIAADPGLGGSVMHRRDTKLVPVNGRVYEVGPDVSLVLSSDHEGDILDQDFAVSDAYAARLYGTLNYMLPSLPNREIDALVLGLPLNTWKKHSKAVAEKFRGRHTINTSGTEVTIHHCEVYPQPFGAYMDYMATHRITGDRKQPMALVLDPGYNSMDWFVCKGMKATEERSKAVNRGMSAVLRTVAEAMIRGQNLDLSVSEAMRLLDHALLTQTPLLIYGRQVDITPYMTAGHVVAAEAAQAVKNSIGAGGDIEIIILAGGGADFYLPALRDKFPHHEIVVLPDAAFANVRGFQLVSEMLAKSSRRATAGAVPHG